MLPYSRTFMLWIDQSHRAQALVRGIERSTESQVGRILRDHRMAGFGKDLNDHLVWMDRNTSL